MSYIVGFLKFWYNFIFGDDWTVAAAIAAALALTAVLAHNGIQAWWLLPLVVLASTAVSVRRLAAASIRAQSR